MLFSKSFCTFLIILGLINNFVDCQSCAPNYCGLNSISCSLINSVPTCSCKTGYVGSKCQLVDPCISKPCNGNGACFPVVQTVIVSGSSVEQVSFFCQCYSGFSGATCLIVGAKPCDSRPCYNNGNCIQKPNSWDYYCDCVGPYTGPTCGTYIDYCYLNRCENEATCIPNPDYKNYTCSCLTGFNGAFCQNEINECAITVNGVLTSPCKNNATCYDLINAYYCDCVGPYGGSTCETYIDPCSSNPCGSGANCIPNGGTFTCTCQAGFFGNPCQPNPCNSNPCKNPSSRCVPVEAGALISINPTLPGGQCVNPSATYICVCPGSSPEFASVLC